MNIVETYQISVKDRQAQQMMHDIACKNIKARLAMIGNAKVLPNVFDYPHGETSEFEYEGLMIMHHVYTQTLNSGYPTPMQEIYEQHELSIECEVN